MTSKPQSWRDCIAIHPAAELFPLMGEDELRELGEDIRKHGLCEGVALLDGELLDGRNRLDAMEMIGVKLVTDNGQPERAYIPFRNIKGADPVAFVLSKNIHRCHLTAEQRRELVEKLIKAAPYKSDRQIADECKSNHNTVGRIRVQLEQVGAVARSATRTDRMGRKQAAHKPSTTKPKDAKVIAAADRAVPTSGSAAPPGWVDAFRRAADIAMMIEAEAERLSGDRRTEFLFRLRDVINALFDDACAAVEGAP
jgi:hypothetical protein